MGKKTLYAAYTEEMSMPLALADRLRRIAAWLDRCDAAVGCPIGDPELPTYQDDLRYAADLLNPNL